MKISEYKKQAVIVSKQGKHFISYKGKTLRIRESQLKYFVILKCLLCTILLLLSSCVWSQTIKSWRLLDLNGNDKTYIGQYTLELSSDHVHIYGDSVDIRQRVLAIKHQSDSNRWQYRLPCGSHVTYFIGLDGMEKAFYKYKNKHYFFIENKQQHENNIRNKRSNQWNDR